MRLVAVVALGRALAYVLYGACGADSVMRIRSAILIASIVSTAIKVAVPWDRVVVLRLGRYHALRGPGRFGIIPVIAGTT